LIIDRRKNQRDYAYQKMPSEEKKKRSDGTVIFYCLSARKNRNVYDIGEDTKGGATKGRCTRARARPAFYQGKKETAPTLPFLIVLGRGGGFGREVREKG